MYPQWFLLLNIGRYLLTYLPIYTTNNEMFSFGLDNVMVEELTAKVPPIYQNLFFHICTRIGTSVLRYGRIIL